ncbi:sulfatase-like hydrolase/transferase [Bacteroides faecis]|nr:sulfatase-like hydrolase/transferase [Bacteroides faecis]
MNIEKHLPWLSALLPLVSVQAETPPNVVIIYIDDMGIGDIGCYGGKFVATPNIDKLAQDGILFNQYYSSAPVSSPSRCGLTTGLFPLEVGINTFLNDKASNKRCEQRNYLDDKLPSMARAFQNAGYATGHIGKWHMGGGRDVHNAPSIKNYGFDEYLSTYESPDPAPCNNGL